jgi:hypothetical protein
MLRLVRPPRGYTPMSPLRPSGGEEGTPDQRELSGGVVYCEPMSVAAPTDAGTGQPTTPKSTIGDALDLQTIFETQGTVKARSNGTLRIYA